MLVLTLTILAFLFLLSIYSAFAITGTSENITVNAGFGTLSSNINENNIVSEIISPWSVIGNYSGADINGLFGEEFDSTESVVSNITLFSPENNKIQTSNVVSFIYNVSSAADDCKLYVDNSLKGINANVNIGSNEFIISGLSASKHYWNMSCTSGSYVDWSNTYAFSVIILPDFDNVTNTTNISMYAVPNFTLEKTNTAKIVFDGYTDLSTGGDMINNIFFSKHSVTINSNALPNLNRTATITMYDVEYINPLIWRDGEICGDCNIKSSDNNTLIFTVTGFSTYNITASTALTVWDDTDTTIIRPNMNITVYASYVDVISQVEISPIDGQCTISINDNGWSAPEVMSYDGISDYYYNITSFNSSGSRPYLINCTNYLGLDDLIVNDILSVSGSLGTLADLIATLGESSRMNLSKPAINLSAEAGNLTELIVDGTTITKSWQGYYGNITGSIYLKDSNNNTMYNWNMSSVSGEIYASRSININWDTITCAQTSELYVEDEFIGANNTIDGDSILNTFFTGQSFNSFYTGLNSISGLGCYAAYLNDESGLGNSRFTEVLLSDNVSLVYTSILNDDVLGFDGRTHDFQILVGENGKDYDDNPTTYYFFLEIG